MRKVDTLANKRQAEEKVAKRVEEDWSRRIEVGQEGDEAPQPVEDICRLGCNAVIMMITPQFLNRDLKNIP